MSSLLLTRGTKVKCSDVSEDDAARHSDTFTLIDIMCDSNQPYFVEDARGFRRTYRHAIDVSSSVFHTAESGAMKDLGIKPRVDLIPSEMIEGLAEVLTYGATKYSDNNWRKGLNNSVHYAAAMRHLLKYWQGIDLDDESGIHHLKHAMTNLGMLVTNINRPELDDRYKDKQ